MPQETSYNINRVLNTIWQKHEISRTLIAEHLEVNRSTITKITNPLIDEGILVMEEKGESTPNGGRRPIDLSLNRDFGIIMGIEIQTEGWNLVATDLYGETLLERSYPLNGNIFDSDTALQFILTRAEQECSRLNKTVIGAGIGISGLVNPYTGVILQSNPMGILRETPFYEGFSKKFPYPVIIENDANCCCYSELIKKKAYRERNFLSILGELRKSQSADSPGSVGIAIGTGIVIKGSVLHGDTFSAGEFQSVFKTTVNDSQFNLNQGSLSRLTYDNAVIRRVMNELSRNIAFLVNMMNFTLINFEGDIVRYEDLLREFLEVEIQANWSYDSKVHCQINFADVGTNAVAHGAAGAVIEKIFSPPLVEEPSDYYPSGIELLRYTRERLKLTNGETITVHG
jgi:predicted NBD/HSP70 family sugar kinase